MRRLSLACCVCECIVRCGNGISPCRTQPSLRKFSVWAPGGAETGSSFGEQGGMWICYRHSDTGLRVAQSEDELRQVLYRVANVSRSEVSEAVRSLYDECADVDLNRFYMFDFLQTIRGIAVCFDHECFIAAITLCGKLLEVRLKETLHRHCVLFGQRSTIGELLHKVRNNCPKSISIPASTIPRE